ncbi:MAG TPA: type II toxin-antitoxin system RelE/ParE family toxin [Tepidisphaeraceae bacterium]|nr:type II toxin-antitoxin system RelE/ParE family toxin [Tepidisphaeraceae bacterium]
MSYILTGPATKDIEEILDYIAAQSVQTAVLVAGRFEKAFTRIAEMPGIGHTRDELKDPNAKVYSVSGYLVIYDPTLSPAHILRIVRGARDLGRITPRP